MKTDTFRMDHGAHYHSTLYRRQVRREKTGWDWAWIDAPLGEGELQFEDDDGVPVDCFGLPLFGEFIETSIKDVDDGRG